ncbi:MAG: IS1182 family transposase [Firmicutes bacterium]|nr:IS1182 family transposase [Bacillota bacterium]
MKKFKEYDPNQVMLMPPSLRDWLPPDHPVYFVSDVVDGFDLSAILDKYREPRGQPPYDPSMMTKVWLYAFMVGIHSSRKLEQALHEDVGFRVLSGNQQPDHWTLSEFRRRHHKELGDLFEQTVQAAERAGLVKLEHVAVDGTKVKANASKHRAMSYGRMKEEEKRLREDIERWFEEVEANDRAEDELYGDWNGWSLPPGLADAEKRLEFIREFRKELERRAEAEKKECGAEEDEANEGSPMASRRRKSRKQTAPENQTRLDFPEPGPESAHKEPEAEVPAAKGRKRKKQAEPKDKAQINFTDPDSRIMLNSDKAFIQGYNAQAAVDAETHIIVAADLTSQAADSPHLKEMVRQVERNTGRHPKELSADAGYWSEANLEALEESGIEAFIPPDRVKHSEWRNMKPPRGRIPKNASPKYLMRRKLRTKRGRARYKLRQTSVEPVFGHIKEVMRFRQLLLRGKDKARSMWRLQCAAFNLMKLYRAHLSAQVAATSA